MKRLTLVTTVSLALLTACQSTPAPNGQNTQNQAQTAYPQGKWQPPAPAYGVVVEHDVKIPMDDGVTLSASIAYPADLATGGRAKGVFPVIIEHMPYEQFAVPIGVNTFFAEHGYISVLARTRGTGKSGGEVDFLGERDGQDGKALVAWASKMDGSDGKVALQGCSWPGAVAMNDAAYVGKNSPLKAVIASCSGLGNMSRQSWFTGGMPTMSFWTFDALGKTFIGDTPSTNRFFTMMNRSVNGSGDLTRQGGFWATRNQPELAEKIVANEIPVMLNAGWKGVVEMGAVRAYVAFQNAYAGKNVYAQMTPDQKTSPRYQLIMGGWDHGNGLDLGLYLQWLDTWLKGVDTGLQHTQTPMHLFEQGTNRWVNLSGYPVINATRYHLGKGTLTSGQSQPQSDTLAYAQPDTPNGKLSYQSEPFKDGGTLSGAISATLYAQSTTPNLVFIAHLYDVAPNGTEQLISQGTLLGSRRALDTAKSWTDKNGVVMYPWHSHTADSLLTPKETYRFDVSLNTRQWGILPNHRLRLDLTAQTPKSLCPDTGAPSKNDIMPCRLSPAQTANLNGANFTVLYGKDTPSALNLPLLAYQAQPSVPSGKLALPWNEGARRLEVGNLDANPAIDNLLPMDKDITHPLVW